MLVYLIRHGETDAMGRGLCGRMRGISLNQTGRLQAVRIAEYLKDEPIVALYSSPLERALETAGELARSRQLEVQPSQAFIEIDHGEWGGKTWEELEKIPLWRIYNTYRSATRCPQGELAAEVQARAASELDLLLERHRDQHIAIISHADVIRATISHYAGIPIDLSLRLEVFPASISTIHLGREGPRLLEINRTVA